MRYWKRSVSRNTLHQGRAALCAVAYLAQWVANVMLMQDKDPSGSYAKYGTKPLDRYYVAKKYRTRRWARRRRTSCERSWKSSRH